MKEYEIIKESDRLYIVKLDINMAKDIYLNSLDEDNKRFVPDEVFNSIEETKELIIDLIECYSNDEGPFIYPLIRKEDKANIGYVQLVKIDEGFEIGYHVAKPYTSNGYAKEGVNAFLEYLKDNTDLKGIIGICLSENYKSKAVLLKCGFIPIFEGEGMYQGHKARIFKSIRKL